MKNLILFVFLFYCCTSPEVIENLKFEKSILENNPVLNLSEETASKTLVDLVKFIEKSNDGYVFHISKDEALQMGATEQEYDDVVKAVGFMNKYLEKAKNQGAAIIMEDHISSFNLSRAYVSAATIDRLLFADRNLLPLVNTPANFSGPSTIIVKGGASSLLWTLVFKENNKDINFVFSNVSPEGLVGKEVKAPLADPNNPTVWNWVISNASGNAAKAWCEFRTLPFDPLNTGTSAPYTHPFPPGFHVRASDQGGITYDVSFTNSTSRSYSYTIRRFGVLDKKGTFGSNSSTSLNFEKNKIYEMELRNERWNEWYNIDWIVHSSR